MSTLKNLLSIADLKKGLENYKKGISSRPENTTQAVWFSLENLKEYIAFFEEKANEKNIPVSGIRFHFTASDESADRINLALCPTTEIINNGKTRQLSFDPIYSEEGKPKDLNEILKNSENANNGSSILNYGSMCPEIC